MNDHLTPNHEVDSELLSAYLDDELTASERVVVEQALKNSPQLRELLQELKILSNEMQWLAVEFHPNEQQMMDTVITKIRDRNLSVHGQAPYSNVKIPGMTKNWKQRLQIPALLTLTAGVLAVLTLQFMPNERDTTLVQADGPDTSMSPPHAIFAPVEHNARELESDTNNSPAILEGAPMGGMGGGRAPFASEQTLPENQEYRDNAKSLAAGESVTAEDPAAPAQSRARSFPDASTMADFADEQRLNKQAADKTDVANVTYHLQVKQKDLPTLLALLTAHQNLAQNMRQRKVVGEAGGEKSIAEEPQPRVLAVETAVNSVQKSTVNQIVLFRSDASQLAALVDILQKNAAFVLSMNHLQRGEKEGRATGEKKKDTPSAAVKNQRATTILSDTIFSIQVIVTP